MERKFVPCIFDLDKECEEGCDFREPTDVALEGMERKYHTTRAAIVTDLKLTSYDRQSEISNAMGVHGAWRCKRKPVM